MDFSSAQRRRRFGSRADDAALGGGLAAAAAAALGTGLGAHASESFVCAAFCGRWCGATHAFEPCESSAFASRSSFCFSGRW